MHRKGSIALRAVPGFCQWADSMAVSEQGCRPHSEDLAGLRVRYAGLRPAGTPREPGTRLPSALAESAQ